MKGHLAHSDLEPILAITEIPPGPSDFSTVCAGKTNRFDALFTDRPVRRPRFAPI
jgi:hypothetical protein